MQRARAHVGQHGAHRLLGSGQDRGFQLGRGPFGMRGEQACRECGDPHRRVARSRCLSHPAVETGDQDLLRRHRQIDALPPPVRAARGQSRVVGGGDCEQVVEREGRRVDRRFVDVGTVIAGGDHEQHLRVRPRRVLEVGPVREAAAAHRDVHDAHAGRRRMFHQVRHSPHGPARIAVGNEHRDRRLLQQQRRGSGPVALGVKRAARGIGVEGTRVEIPEIEADQNAVLVAGEPRCDLRQQVVHSGIDQCDPDAGASDPVLVAGGRRGGDRRIQRLDPRRPFESAQEVLDGARRSVLGVRQPPARHYIAGAIGQCEEHRSAPDPSRFGVARHDPAQDAVVLDAVDSDACTVGKHQRMTDPHISVTDAKRCP